MMKIKIVQKCLKNRRKIPLITNKTHRSNPMPKALETF